MEILIILALCAAVVWLWRQVEALRQRVVTLEDAGYAPSSPRTDPVSGPTSAAATPAAASVPRIALKRRSEAGEAVSQSLPSKERAAQPAVREARPGPVTSTTGEPAPAETPSQADAADASAEDLEAEPYQQAKKRFDIEDIFGRRLPIWAGGITLAIAGVLLVRYSIEAGLVTPPVRVAMAFLFGGGLLAGAEFAHRKPEAVGDPRICQALAGAGLATLYAAFYLAGTQYGLIGQTLAFAGLAAVTAGAIALSFRFGLPCAVLGLVGGFAAPLLVGGEEANLPILTIYLGLVTVGLTQAGERQGRPWLSLAALAVGLGWGVLLLLSDDFGTAEILALGFYLLLLGAVLPSLVSGGAFARPVRLASAFVASLQLALLVDRAGDGLLAWALYLLMGATLAGLAWRRSELREGSAVAMVIAVGLLTLWDPAVGWVFYALAAAIAVIFMAVPLVHFRHSRDTLADRAQIAAGPVALAGAMFVVAGEYFTDNSQPVLAAGILMLAAFPAAGAWAARSFPDKDKWTAVYTAVSALLVLAAALLVTPSWTAPLVSAAIFAGLLVVSHRREDGATSKLLNGAGVVVGLTLLTSGGIDTEIGRLFTGQTGALTFQPVLRWGAAALALGALAWRTLQGRAFAIAQAATALAAYGLAAQILPATALPWTAALAVIALRFARFGSLPAQAALCTVAALWAFVPTAMWTETGVAALAGQGPLAQSWPAAKEALLRLLPLAAALFALPYSGEAGKYSPARLPRAVGLGVLLVAAHVLYKQAFGIETQTAFVSSALAERTIWQALLVAAAYALLRPLPHIGAQPVAAMALAGAAFAHLLWFTGAVHNPLFSAQAVGPVPLANLALAAAAVALAALWLIRGLAGLRGRQAVDALAMIVTSVTALALLRQMFSGSILTAQPLGQTEDLLRSLLGIVLAIGFLLIGRMRGEQSWRIGSLVLMLLAVAKVFLVDAAALEGLLRIASFMALGFSLLGIGWLYARQLGGGPKEMASAPQPS